MLVAVSVMACAQRGDNAEIQPSDAVALSASEGIVVGVAVIAETPSGPVGWGQRSDDLSFELYASGFHSLPITYFAALLPDRVEQGAKVQLRPFAYRLPAGDAKFYALRVNKIGLQQTGETTSFYNAITKRSETAYRTEPVDRSVNERLPEATFSVAAGKVTYIGRIGVLFHVTGYGMRLAERDNACFPDERRGTRLYLYCVQRDVFLGNAPQADLPLIRQAFPNLPNQEVEVQPLKVDSGSWRRLPESLRMFTGR